MKKQKVLSTLVLSAALSASAFAASPARPESWAVAVSARSVPNLWRVEPDLYRSARPESAGFQELEKLGVKAVLDVESPADEAAARGTSLKLYHVPMSAFGLQDESVLAAMRILSDPANRPIVIHCQHGADRTGAMMALYRVVVEGWSKDDAIKEMNAGGYHHSSWFSNLDRYVAAADVDSLRQKLGIAKPGMTLLAALGKAPADLANVGTAAVDVAASAINAVTPAVTMAAATVKADLKTVTTAVTNLGPKAADPKPAAETASLATTGGRAPASSSSSTARVDRSGLPGSASSTGALSAAANNR